MRQRHQHQFGEIQETDRHETMFGRGDATGACRSAHGRRRDRESSGMRTAPPTFLASVITFTVPGLFLQDDLDVTPWLSLSASGRLDRHSEYGTFFSPRLAVLLRSGSWNSRLSLGTGFFGPSALTEETEAAGLTRLQIPAALRAEKAAAPPLTSAGPMDL
jgi:iron complex outermembrane receptor protein